MLSWDMVDTGGAALGFGDSDEICLVDGCYIIEVNGTNVTQDSAWSFATLSGGVPYGPTPIAAINGTICRHATCSSQHSSKSNLSKEALIGGIVIATVFIVVLLGYFGPHRIVMEDRNTDDCCYTVGKKLKNAFGASFDSVGSATCPDYAYHLTGGDEESAVSNGLRSTTANDATPSFYDAARRDALRQALVAAKTTIPGLRAAGSAIPALEGVLCALQTILEHIEALLHKADDLLAAGERIITVIEALQLLVNTTTSLDTTTIERATVETCMNELKESLEAFALGILCYYDKGWLRQKWIVVANRHSPDLAAVDAKLVNKLDDHFVAYQIARDQSTDALFSSQTYVLEAVMKEQIERLVSETGKDPHDVASALAENEAAILAVAEAAHIDVEELKRELPRLPLTLTCTRRAMTQRTLRREKLTRWITLLRFLGHNMIPLIFD